MSSYRFDTRVPNSEVVKFDEFRIAQPIKSPKTSQKAAELVTAAALLITILIITAGLIGIEYQNIAKLPLP